MSFKLLTAGNPKVAKGEKFGYLTFILHLAPARLSGYNTCPMATAGCSAACLNTAGRGGMVKLGESTNCIQQARIRKTRWFFEQRESFMELLVNEIERGIEYAQKHGLTPAFRLNGTSDVRWETVPVKRGRFEYPNVMEAFATVQFYDYTKLPNRRVGRLHNYHLTFSRADGNDEHVRQAVSNGFNVAVVFRKDGPRVKVFKSLEQKLAEKAQRDAAREARRGDARERRPYRPRKVDLSWIPTHYMGLPTFHGDKSDLRFLDPKGVVVAVAAKGEAKYDTSGFVVDVYPNQQAG